MKKSIAWILRLKPSTDRGALLPKGGADRALHAENTNRKPLTVEELDRAEETILKLVQSGAFLKEKKLCKKFDQ